jgi:hypothetical protein
MKTKELYEWLTTCPTDDYEILAHMNCTDENIVVVSFPVDKLIKGGVV